MERKFVDSIPLEGWEIETDIGWKPCTGIHKTIDYEVWEVETKNHSIRCADTHIVFDSDYNNVYVEDLKVDDCIITKSGNEAVKHIKNTHKLESMYDITVESVEHRFYSNGILSHNTTVTSSFLLWYILFHSDKSIGILANKARTAQMIVNRMQLSYTLLPKWLQQGVTDWNKQSFTLENGSRIISAATSSDSIRGESLNCVTGDTKVTILDENWCIYLTSIESLSQYIKNKNISLKVLTTKGYKSFYGVKVSYNNKKIKLTFNDSSELKCTYDHLLQLANGEFKTAEELNKEDILWNNIQLVDKVFYEDDKLVYDLVNVEETSAYITNNVVSHNCLYIDEAAFIPSSVFDEFFKSVYPTISSSKTSKIILVSTPNGPNFFHTIWKKAQEGTNGYVPFQVNWWDVPGRDEKWKEEQIAATDEETFNQEFGCDFNTNTLTLISSDRINYIETMALKPVNFNRTMKIYKNPQKNHTYVLSCDVADQGIDFSVVSVIDITEYPWEQVCVYRENISYIMFPPVIMHIANMYNNGYILVENNDVGKTILHVLNYEYELENIISTQASSGRGRPVTRYELGQRTTTKTKSLGCTQFKQLVNSNKLKINNDWTIEEIKHFCVDNKGSYSSDSPNVHDDCVMTLVNFSYFSTTPTYKLLFDKDVGEDIRAEEERMIEESLLPIPMESRNIDDSEWTADEIKWVNQ